MIDLSLLRENPDLFRASQRARQADVELVDRILEADASRRQAISEFESLRAEQKAASKDIGRLAGAAKKDPSQQGAFEQAKAQAAQLAQAQKQAGEDTAASTNEPGFNINDFTSSKKVDDDEEDDDAPIDESGVDQKDIDLVMEQVSCSRRKAVKALKDNNGDLINAIMSVS